jgi:hypothetical protein
MWKLRELSCMIPARVEWPLLDRHELPDLRELGDASLHRRIPVDAIISLLDVI